MLHAMILMLLGMLGPAQTAPAEVGEGPSPSPLPVSWELKFDYLEPRRIEVRFNNASRPEVYWYMVYTVTNTSGRTQRFYPTFQLVTDDLRVIDTDMGINRAVFDAIRARHAATHSEMVHPTKAIGDLLAGEDYARESVAIWRATDVNVNNFRIFVAGLSGEARVDANPTYDPDKPETAEVRGADGVTRSETVNPKYFTLRKTLEIAYSLAGSEVTRALATPERLYSRWIMR